MNRLSNGSDRANTDRRWDALDGWRAISILLVLATHMLPLGPSRWQLNATAGPMGMSLFFTLSGFLITQTLLRNPSVPAFLLRRLARILPLAWLATLVFMLLQRQGPLPILATMTFLINYQGQYITELTSPYWSLCVEIHFYLLMALVVWLGGLRGLLILPWLGLAVTATRIVQGVPVSIVTHLRVDEILAGVTLALLWSERLGSVGNFIRSGIAIVPWPCWWIALACASHPSGGDWQYLRPYCGAALVGQALWRGDGWWPRQLRHPWLKYIAEISYALYVIHSLHRWGWFATGPKWLVYAKRVLALALTWCLAHLSTRYWEHPWIEWAKRRSQRDSITAR